MEDKRLEFRKIIKYTNGYIIRIRAETDCPECDCSRAYVEHFFWDDPADYIDIEIDTRSYITNQAACSRFVCPSCKNYWKV